MSLQYGIFQSEVVDVDEETGLPIYDKAVTEEFLGKLLFKLYGEGIFPSPANNFQILTGTGLTVTRKAGYMFAREKFAYDLDDALIALPDDAVSADGSRYALLVFRVDAVNKQCIFDWVLGEVASTNFVIPSLTRTDDVYELGIAAVLVRKGTTEITNADITDLRYDSAYCGVVANAINTIDMTDLFAQFDDEFETWFENAKGQLGTDPAGHLQNEIDGMVDGTKTFGKVAIKDDTNDDVYFLGVSDGGLYYAAADDT